MSRTALVTGANSGLGLATVLELARGGIDTVGTVRSGAKAELVAAAAAEAGVEVRTVLLDVTDAAGCKEVVDRVRPDILVNNAGGTSFAPVLDVMEEEARHHLEVALFGPLRLARFAIPHMRERGWGRVVQISSLAGRVTYPLLGWYQAGKHAMEAVSDALRVEVAGAGVDVVVVAPGGFHSGVTGDMADAVERYRGSAYATAFQRMDLGFQLMKPLWSTPEKVARTIALAATVDAPDSRYVIGADAHLTLFVHRVTEPLAAVRSIKEGVVRRVTGLR
ncbi:SDR family NAD(P)-dependent oxidoreductase [Embleya sp. NBC_00896]|uniref:SDR family NAD(P)-dependent oxidoreductase n=1 Tax=Embleya sp. NBC_00896 TaxID=2975961 RepID=UPI003865BDD3|nr:SDR family NAD(P)-dependent oxidoreductase [Embleya sp. NBC_00896]